ncbi:15833_t:CDS:2, partial [Funneliformis caledonium]
LMIKNNQQTSIIFREIKTRNLIMTSSDDEKDKNHHRDFKKDKHKFRIYQITSESDISFSDSLSSSSD